MNDIKRPRSALVLALPAERAGAAPPLSVLAGLPLVLRTVLTLQKEGVSRFWVQCAGPDKEGVQKALLDKRVHAQVSVIETLSEARDELYSQPLPVIAAMSDVAVNPAVYRMLLDVGAGEQGAAACRSREPIGPFAAMPAVLLDGIQPDADPQKIAGQLLKEGRLTPLEISALWAYSLRDKEGRAGAVYSLFEACRKPVDGLVARYINRNISIFISKRIVGLPFTPNMISVVTFLIGVAGAVFAARGGYWNLLLGAFLFQWNSILDGVDGELARVRFQHSKLGQWIDTVGDDVANMIFYVGLAYGSLTAPYGNILFLLGWVGTIVTGIIRAIDYSMMIRAGSGDLYAIEWDIDKKPAEGLIAKLVVFFRYALKKDFALLFFLGLAVFGVLPAALLFIGAGSVATLIATLIRIGKPRK